MAYTRQLLGGSCSEVVNSAASCRTPVPGCIDLRRARHRVRSSTSSTALEPGQDLNLQAYVLVTGTNPTYTTSKDRWDCTNPNPAYHWANDAERYCFADFQRIVMAIPEQPQRRRDRSRRRGSGVGHDATDEVIVSL